MSDNTLIFYTVLLRSLCVIAAIAGVVYLAHQGKAGWGWLIVLAVVLSAYSIKADSDKHRAGSPAQPPAPSTNNP